MRNSPPLIGVLTPYTGGFYYGAMLAGIHSAARARGACAVAIHTTGLELSWPDEPGTESLAWDSFDGWIALNGFSAYHLTSRIALRGRPLVYVSERPENNRCCSVLPDNEGGAYALTRHLIEHGHRRIAFGGLLGQFDLRERYEGYMAAHRDCGIEIDRSLLYWTKDGLELDGLEVGRRLVEAKLPCTALVAGTDKIALGVTSVLQQAGYRVPQDLAVVGFDDIEKAQYAEPPLTTVRQSFDLLGARAAETLLAHMLDGVPLPNVQRVSTTFVTRESCGCQGSEGLSSVLPAASEVEPAEGLCLALLDAAGRGRTEPVTRESWPGASQIAEQLHAVAAGGLRPEAVSLNGVWRGYLECRRDVEGVEAIINVLETYSRNWVAALEGETPDDGNRRSLELNSLLRQLRVDLMRRWRVAEQVRNRNYDLVTEANARLNVALTGNDFANAKNVSWLRWTRVPYGALGLWNQTNGVRQLNVIGEYGAKGASTALLGTTHAPNQFPPSDVRDLWHHVGAENMFMILPVVGGGPNRGLLFVASPLEYELLEHISSLPDWAALVGASLGREEVEEQLKEHALRDALTGMPNRAALMQRLEQRLDATTRSRWERFAVLYLDLDDFKNINESLGHLAGDDLLVDIARRLEGSLRDTDLIARLGGDEFAILVPDLVHEDEVFEVVARLKQALQAPFLLEGNPVFTSCSIGVVFSGEHHKNAADLLRDADTAMYRAKVQGRGGHEVFDSGMHVQAVERLQLDAQLRRALDRGEFVLYYQPLFSLRTGKPMGAEALIRWNHPEQGLLSPAQFLAVAEEVGLAIPISHWVMETACREVERWRAESGLDLYVNVNVPIEHFNAPDFITSVQSTLERWELPPRALGLELVEGSLIEDQKATIDQLHQLQDLGVKTAVDDFGTGYSSLSYLKRFPLSVIKLDRSFIQGLPEDPHDTAIVRAIIAMAHGLKLTVVAEGVELDRQARFLKSEGCDIVQGYLFSRPLPAEEARALLVRHENFQLREAG